MGESEEVLVAVGDRVVAFGQDMEKVDQRVLVGLSVVFVVEKLNEGFGTLLGAGGFW